MKRGELWWADLGAHRPGEQTGKRPVVTWQSDALSRALRSILVIPLTTNTERAKLAGTAVKPKNVSLARIGRDAAEKYVASMESRSC